MINYFKQLQTQIKDTKNQINNEEDNYKKIILKFNLNRLNDILNNFYHTVINNFDKKQIKDFSIEIFGHETVNKAEEDSIISNSKILNILIKQSYEPMDLKKSELNELLKANPNLDSDEFANSELQIKAKNLRKDISKIQEFIDETRSRLASFYDKLSDENKDTLITQLINNLDKGKVPYETIFNQIKNYKSSFDFDRNKTNMVEDKFNILTKENAKDKELANYLLENKEAIDRLASRQDNDVLVSISSSTASEIAYQAAEGRQKLFSTAADFKKIGDICDDQGQFIANKIYFDKEAYNRYSNCIQELKISNDVKEKFKMLLKEMDMLNIIDENASAAESSYKEYGFLKLLKAKQKFFDEMNSEQPSKENVQIALENLKSEEEKIKKMYNLIANTLGDDFKTMPGNVDSIRNMWVPSEFKENLVINSKFNSLYVMLTFIKENNLTIDEFIENPITISNNAYQKEVDKRNLNKVLKGKSKAEALLYLVDETKGLPNEDPYKYTRNIELLSFAEENDNFNKENILSITAVTTKHGILNRVVTLKSTYFGANYKETLQNIFLAKENKNNEIPYLDCYVCNKLYQDDMETGFIADDRLTVLQKIAKDNNIVSTFYSAMDTLKEYLKKEKDIEAENKAISKEAVFSSFQELAAKMILTLNLKDKNQYPEQFIYDLKNVVKDYKSVDALKDVDIKLHNTHNLTNLIALINNKDESIKSKEIIIKDQQKAYDDEFIKNFEKINKEIDKLDAKVTKIEKKLKKGETNKEIDDITIEILKKNNEIRELQNARIRQLRNDLENGTISKFFFERKVEQVILLKDINTQPPLFMCDDKNYKDFKTYRKNILKNKGLSMNNDEMIQARTDYANLINNSKEEKRLFLLTKILEEKKLGVIKTENARYVNEIQIVDNVMEYQNVIDERNEIEASNKEAIVVNLNEDYLSFEDNEIKEEPIEKNLEIHN